MSLPEVIERRIVRTADGCWNVNTCSTRGYRRITWQGRRQYAHRVVYGLLVGDVPEGSELDHLCRNRACCNPAHLEPVTHSVNVSRGVVGSINTRRAAERTHCAQGHPYDETNTYGARGQRACHECHRAWTRAWKARKQERESA